MERKAESGDTTAVHKLIEYWGRQHISVSPVELKELRQKAKQGDKNALEMVNHFDKCIHEIDKWIYLGAEKGCPDCAYKAAINCLTAFQDSINIKENKKKYRKYMEIVVSSGYKEDEELVGSSPWDEEYKSKYMSQSEDWWNSDSIYTKEDFLQRNN